MAEVFFFLAAIGAVAGAAGTVALRDAFYWVLALVCHLIFLAMLFLLLRAEFVAAAQVIVYAGAVMVLYVFVVGYVGGMEAGLAGRSRPRAADRLGRVRARAVRRAVDRADRLRASRPRHRGRAATAGLRRAGEVGRQFLTNYLVAFEVASLLLLVAAVGAVILARRRTGAGRPARDLGRRPDAHAADQGRRARGHDDRSRRTGAQLMPSPGTSSSPR